MNTKKGKIKTGKKDRKVYPPNHHTIHRLKEERFDNLERGVNEICNTLKKHLYIIT